MNPIIFVKLTVLFLCSALIALLAVSCEDSSLLDASTESNEVNDSNAPSTLRVVLTDAPGDFEAVYIDIREIQVRMVEVLSREDTDVGTIVLDEEQEEGDEIINDHAKV